MSCEIYIYVHGPDRLQRLQRSYPDFISSKLTSSYWICWLYSLQLRCSELPIWEIYCIIFKFYTPSYKCIEKIYQYIRKKKWFNSFSPGIIGKFNKWTSLCCEDSSSFISALRSDIPSPKVHKAFLSCIRKGCSYFSILKIQNIYCHKLWF